MHFYFMFTYALMKHEKLNNHFTNFNKITSNYIRVVSEEKENNIYLKLILREI